MKLEHYSDAELIKELCQRMKGQVYRTAPSFNGEPSAHFHVQHAKVVKGTLTLLGRVIESGESYELTLGPGEPFAR